MSTGTVCRGQRRAFVVIELVVAAGLLSLILAGAWLFYAAGSRGSARVDERLDALQARLLLLERLTSDVGQAVRARVAGAPEARDDGTARVVWGRELLLSKFVDYAIPDDIEGHSGLELQALRTEVIRYRFDPDEGALYREGRPLPLPPLREVCFGLDPEDPGHLSVTLRTAASSGDQEEAEGETEALDGEESPAGTLMAGEVAEGESETERPSSSPEGVVHRRREGDHSFAVALGTRHIEGPLSSWRENYFDLLPIELVVTRAAANEGEGE